MNPDTQTSELWEPDAELRMWCCNCGLTQVEGQVDRVGVLNTIEHRLALPPRGFLVRVEVCQQAGVVAEAWV